MPDSSTRTMASLLTSIDPSSVLLGGAVLLCLLWWLSTRRPTGLPPGPGPALPLLGHLHLMPKDPRAKFWAWRRQYGDVFSLYMGGRLVVVLASSSAIREALVTLADVFSDRPRIFYYDEIFTAKGLSGSSGRTFKEIRKASLEILRNMGMGKNMLAEKIQEEITHYIRAIKDHQGAPVDLARQTQVSISNNISSITFGKRFDYHDPKFISYLRCMDEIMELTSGVAVLNYLPILRYLPGDPFNVSKILASIEAVHVFIKTIVAEHQEAFKEGKMDNTDFIYSYLRLIQEQRTRGVVDSSLDEESLENTVIELFMAGTVTVATVLSWALFFFLHYPHVQDKCFKEISDVVGPHRPPTMQDKPNLTYLEATICEVLRKSDVAPLSEPHAAARDVKFRGYIVPQGTVVLPGLTFALQDPEIWGDPGHFRPERFIGPDGKLIRPEEFIPFSTGHRVCPGEPMARMELFLYLATLIQHFHFLPPEDEQLPSLEGDFGSLINPQSYKICAVPRI